MKRWITGLLTLILMLSGITELLAQQDKWPHTVMMEQGLVTIYSPQIEEMTGNTIRYRAALAYRETTNADPVFGAGWFESPVEIDEENGTVHPTVLIMTETRFPDGTDDIKASLTASLAAQSPAWNLVFSRDELDSALKQAQAESRAAEKLNTSPPDVIYRDHPALLVTIDGEPVLRDIENSPYQAVINTPYPLISDNRNFYLNVAKDVWYRASKATGPYRFEPRPPSAISSMVKESETETHSETSVETITAANAPEIVVSTKPAELIVTEGPAAFVPLIDDLLVLENSESDVFMHVDSQQFYIVLAGRWYHAKSLDGPWSWKNADELPVAFANIPKDSDQADSRVYVAGTPEAREAVLDSQVPQTAAIERGPADVEVKYDGEPVYAPVDGTDLVYIKNTGSTVLRSGGLFYLVEDGVWYVSASANGPWQVSDQRPGQVDTILPTSPVYNSKYVYIYDSTPEVVYVGYTPGYVGSYVYRNTIFYGTGWYYRPWISPYYYYPRLSTWGFSVSYNSWSGWNFGLSWGWGPFSIGYYPGGYWHHSHYWHHNHYGYWGPRGYRPRHGHSRHGGKRYAHNDYRSHNNRSYNGSRDYRSGDRGRYDGGERHDNLYRDRSQRARVANTHDRRTHDNERRYQSTRLANSAAGKNSHQRSYTGVKKGERNRVTPVRKADLKKKAVVRDISRLEMRRGALLADNNGDVYRNPTQTRRNASVSRRDVALKSPDNRRRSSTNISKQNTSQKTVRYKQQKSKRSSSKNGERQTTQPIKRSSSKAASIRVADNRARQASPTRANTSTRKSQQVATGKTTRVRSAPSAKVSRQKTQPVKRAKTKNQRPQIQAVNTSNNRSNVRVKTQSKLVSRNVQRNTVPKRSTPPKTTRKSNKSSKVANRSSSKRNTNKGNRN